MGPGCSAVLSHWRSTSLTEPGGVRAILVHLGLPSRPAQRAAAQMPSLLDALA
ncbi:Hypothetical protein AA314_02451 [Archangium gephyra]|uniref:Uncharacterized protein n=1 Tax=Archangium gephyra TaxID=48 RepID=A0AAC8TCE9_9BACT|nr:Hypothetical protein AA314_02451 [Archangium gephyra]